MRGMGQGRWLRAAVLGAAVTVTVAGPAAAQGTEPLPASVAAAIARMEAEPAYTHAQFGYAVQDLDSGQYLFDRNGEDLMVTGSILKSFSVSGALNGLGPDYRFRTPVYRTGAVRRGTLRDDLVLVASGDMSMGMREKPGGRLFFDSAPRFDHTYANAGLNTVPVAGNPLAGLNALAHQVRRSGIRRVGGDVVIDARLFESFNQWPDVTVSPASPIVINDNRIDITSVPGRAGARAAVRWRPRTAAYRVRTTARTVRAGGQTELTVTQPSARVFEVSGTIAADAGRTLRVGEIPDPESFARTAFIEALERNGVQVRADATAANPVRRLPPERALRGRRRVALHTSAEMAEFAKVVLKTSHNPGADLMACLNAVAIGSRDCEQGLVAETRHAIGLGLDPDTLFIFDGAGSDERDHVTPKAMTTLYRSILLSDPSGRPPLPARPIGAAFRDGLSILGVDGDIGDLDVGPARGQVRAKTGTRVSPDPSGNGILTARTIVGYVEAKSGRRLVASVFVAGVPLKTIPEIFDVVEDNAKIMEAIQQGY